MDSATGHPVCSLCHHELSTSSFEAGAEARLCDECRGLIRTALHGHSERAAAASATVREDHVVVYAHSGPFPGGSVEPEPPAFFGDLPAFGNTSPLSKQTEVFNVNNSAFDLNFDEEPFDWIARDDAEVPVVEAAKVEAAHSKDAVDEPAPFVVEAPLEHEPAATFQPSEYSFSPSEYSFSDAALESIEDHQQGFVEPLPANEGAPAQVGSDLSALHQSLSDFQNHEKPSLATSPLVQPSEHPLGEQEAVSHEDLQLVTEPAPVDPGEVPLPAWDYSKNEYKVLMGPPREKSFSKYKIPLALFFILASAAGLYYLIHPQPSRDQSRTAAVPSQTAAETHAATQKPDEQAAQSPPASAPSAAQVSPAITDTKPAQQAPAPNEPNNAQGRFALQAAAFPTQAGADEFAEKLKAAGVPSYVIAADLAHKGRWFRVRVGRFNSSAEAQSFAAEAQLRARSAGISLQLMVSQYDQP